MPVYRPHSSADLWEYHASSQELLPRSPSIASSAFGYPCLQPLTLCRRFATSVKDEHPKTLEPALKIRDESARVPKYLPLRQPGARFRLSVGALSFSDLRLAQPSVKGTKYMRRLLVGLALGTVTSLGTASFAAAGVAPRSTATTLNYFGKSLTSKFTNPAGMTLAAKAAPAVGDQYFSTGDLYRGSHARYTKTLAASDELHCNITRVTKTVVIGNCVGVIAIGNSLIISVSAQNFDSDAKTTAYPVTGGTGAFNGAAGRVATTTIGKTNNTDFTIDVSTP